jgi:hypothetical protein
VRQESFRPTAAAGLSVSHRWLLLCGHLILGPLALVTLVVVALQIGVWRKDVDIAGPFAAEINPPQHSLILTVPSDGPAPWWRQPLNGDSVEKPFESGLRLQIDGRTMGPAHSRHELIREGKTEGYSHWGKNLIFLLPPGVQNSRETKVTLHYSVRPRLWVTLLLLATTLSLGWLLSHQSIEAVTRFYWAPSSPVRRYADRLAAFLLPLPHLILAVLCCVGLFSCAVFAGFSLYALASGWALPTTAPIRWLAAAEWAARNEPYFGFMLLTLAVFGTLTTWFAVLTGQGHQSIRYPRGIVEKLFVADIANLVWEMRRLRRFKQLFWIWHPRMRCGVSSAALPLQIGIGQRRRRQFGLLTQASERTLLKNSKHLASTSRPSRRKQCAGWHATSRCSTG